MWVYEELSVWLPPSDALVRRRTSPRVQRLAHLAWREDAEAYYLEGSFRDFRKRDIAIEARDHSLEIRAERERGIWKTREHSSFRQVVTIPGDADATQIDATFEGGELSIRIPKLAHVRPRAIPVRVNGVLPPARDDRSQRATAGASFFQRTGDTIKRWFSNGGG